MRAPARVASSVRFATSSLAKTWDRCAFTVERLTNRRAAISGLDKPSVTRSTTSRSVGVRLSQPDCGRPRGPRPRVSAATVSSAPVGALGQRLVVSRVAELAAQRLPQRHVGLVVDRRARVTHVRSGSVAAAQQPGRRPVPAHVRGQPGHARRGCRRNRSAGRAPSQVEGLVVAVAGQVGLAALARWPCSSTRFANSKGTPNPVTSATPSAARSVASSVLPASAVRRPARAGTGPPSSRRDPGPPDARHAGTSAPPPPGRRPTGAGSRAAP